MKKAKILTFLSKWLPAIFWSVFIFVMSSLPGADFASKPGNDFFIRKILHIVEYSILCLTYYRGSKNVTASVLGGMIFAFTDELHQEFTPTRTGKPSDILIDSSAVLLMGLILWKFYHHLPRKLKTWLEG